ncbi:hypothetical protein J6590_025634 [Homalodisca vitripennis]|nr:hypothetical protein J6590_025634 [Homalodisca vitripennis]
MNTVIISHHGLPLIQNYVKDQARRFYSGAEPFEWDETKKGYGLNNSRLENGTWFRHPATGRPWSNYTTCVDLYDLRVTISCPDLLVFLILS